MGSVPGQALGSQCCLAMSCAGFNCMKVSDPKIHPMLLRAAVTHPSKPCLGGCAFSQEHKQEEADAHSQLMPKSLNWSSNWTGGVFPPGDSQECTEIAAVCPECREDKSWDRAAPSIHSPTNTARPGNEHPELCKAGPKSQPGSRELPPDVFVFPLNDGRHPLHPSRAVPEPCLHPG